MIEINLLPEELKLKITSSREGIPSKLVVYAVAAILALLLIAHAVLAIVFVVRGSQLALLHAQWAKAEPQRKALENARKELEALSHDAQASQQLISQRTEWGRKLNRLSLDVPAGVWFDDLSFARNDFSLHCSVISLQKEEMGLVNRFIEALKADPDFYSDFSALELGSITVRAIGGHEVTDFTISGTLRQRGAQGR